MGLGISGRSAARYALACGAEILVSDVRDEKQLLEEEGEFLKTSVLDWEAGGHTLNFLLGADLVLVSPGVDLLTPLISELQKVGKKIAGELAVVSSQFDVPVVAVTGTNGKTTVTTLIGEILEKSGKCVFVGGNIGTPLYDFFLSKKKYDLVVAEVSSFQLETSGDFAPDVALLLNITADHLDRHRTLENYIDAKMLLFRNQNERQVAIVNGDDLYCQNLDPDFSADFFSFGGNKYNDLIIDSGTLTGTLTLMREGGRKEFSLDQLDCTTGFIAENYAATILALDALGCSAEVIERGLDEFQSLPHRLEFVLEADDVKYYNDSKATNTGAVIGALQQLDEKIILIAGGRDKGENYSVLREVVQGKVRLLVLIGEASGLIEQALNGVVKTVAANSLAEAVDFAKDAAEHGDTVLFSPACASFDMFDSYAHRGNEFKRIVRECCSMTVPAKLTEIVKG